jgi:hypothetical protein
LPVFRKSEKLDDISGIVIFVILSGVEGITIGMILPQEIIKIFKLNYLQKTQVRKAKSIQSFANFAFYKN